METTNQNRRKKKAIRRLFLHMDHARMTLKDWVVMLAVTLVYAVVAFANLGALDIHQIHFIHCKTTATRLSLNSRSPRK